MPETGKRKPGRPALFFVAATRSVEFRVTSGQLEALRQVASDERKTVSSVIRDAVNEYVSDYRERVPFDRDA